MTMAEVAKQWVDAHINSGRDLLNIVEVVAITNKYNLLPAGLYEAVVAEVESRAEV